MGDYEYLRHILEDLGTTMPGVNGPEPLTYQEIDSYVRLTGVELTPQEVFAIRRASSAYIDNLLKGEDPHAAAPWQPIVEKSEEEISIFEGRLVKMLTSRNRK